MNQERSGGFNFGNVGGNVNIRARGDIVGHDKITTTHAGFDDQAQKQKFLGQLDELRAALREIKTQVESVEQFDQDAKEELVAEILGQVSELNKATKDAEQLEPGRSPPVDTLQSVGHCLDNAGGLLDKIKGFGSAASGIATSIAPVIAKALPILATARHLLGISSLNGGH